ncbi:MAG: RES family NAD+ phosphorylase [Truepera sp.]|nr:RES family NAD+ phosphorylase [Truepera sp.]
MTGMGAFLHGARWNAPGQYVVYASGNLSLAMLEVLVHLDDAEALWAVPHVYHSLRWPERIIATLDRSALPKGWNDRPETLVSQAVGNEWLERQASAVLAVPSVVTPPELRFQPLYMNYPINPRHPDFAAVAVGQVYGLEWDTRLR